MEGWLDTLSNALHLFTNAESVFGILIGVGLSAAAGFRVFIPLLGLSIAGYFQWLPLGEGFAWIASWQALVAFSVAALLEVGAYYIPWLDHALDMILAPAAAIAGTILTASTVGDVSPFLKWSLAIVAGGGVSSLVHLGTSGNRAAASLPSGGLANPLISSGEGLAALIMTVLAIILAPIAFILSLLLLYRILRQLSSRKSASGASP